MWMYTLQTTINIYKKLYSGSDYYYGEKGEKLWQRKEKHKLFLFCIELSFQEKGYGFLDFIE